VSSQWRAGSGVSRRCNHIFVAVTVAVLGGMAILTAYPAEPPAEAAPQVVCKLDLSNLEPREPAEKGSTKIPPGYRTQAEIVQLALADAKGLPEGIRREVHYLSLGHIPFSERAEFIRVLSYHVNDLSRKFELIPPRVCSPDGCLLSVVDTDYSWQSFGKLGQFDKVWHEHITIIKGKETKTQVIQARWLPPKEIAELALLTNTTTPILNADFFMGNSARQLSVFDGQDHDVGYASFLGLKDRKSFDDLIKFRKQDSIEIGRDQRAALNKSGISIYGRQIELFAALTGTRYGTLDADTNVAQSNPVNNLKSSEYVHKAEEQIAFLPNGLPVWFLNNAGGERQVTAPDFVGSNDAVLHQGRDFRIHVGPLACGECHLPQNVLRPIDDYVRKNAHGPTALGAISKKDFDDLRRQYATVLESRMDADRLLFAGKILEVCGMKPADLQKAYSARFYKYALGGYGTEEIAAMMGCEESTLMDCLKAFNKRTGFIPLADLSGLYNEPQDKMRVEHVEESYNVLTYVRLLEDPKSTEDQKKLAAEFFKPLGLSK
jgi:hypothetical protein